MQEVAIVSGLFVPAVWILATVAAPAVVSDPWETAATASGRFALGVAAVAPCTFVARQVDLLQEVAIVSGLFVPAVWFLAIVAALAAASVPLKVAATASDRFALGVAAVVPCTFVARQVDLLQGVAIAFGLFVPAVLIPAIVAALAAASAPLEAAATASDRFALDTAAAVPAAVDIQQVDLLQGVATVVVRFVLDIEAVDIAVAAPAIGKADTVAAGPDTGAVDIAAAYVAAETIAGSALALPHAVPIAPVAFLKK